MFSYSRVVKSRNQGFQKIITAHTKFKQLEEDQTLKRERMLQRLLRKLKDNGHLSVQTYNNIYPKGSRPAQRLYGLPKMHKSRAPNTIPPFRRILSSIGIYNYNLSKYLCSLQQPNIPTDYCAKDTSTFVKELQNFKSMHGNTWSLLMLKASLRTFP